MVLWPAVMQTAEGKLLTNCLTYLPVQRLASTVPCRLTSLSALSRQQRSHAGSERQRQSSFQCQSCLTSFLSQFSGLDNRTLASTAAVSSLEEPLWDVVGLGQAMVDFQAAVDDSLLEQLCVKKGDRRVITVEERAKILELLNDSSYQVSAGGSLANTLASLARLGQADALLRGKHAMLRVAAVSIAGSDALGAFHTAQQRKAGVETLSEPLEGSSTGTVVVLTTPDANRTFLSYLGTAQELALSPAAEAAICRSRIVALEGYLWEMPNAAASIQRAIEVAHSAGTLVALTAGDANVVGRHREDIWRALNGGVDLLFANRSEAQALLDCECTAEEAALRLGPYCSMVVITDGANGSCLSAMGRLQVVPPFWSSSKPVDTCGAGDGYAAGLLYGWLSAMSTADMGRCGARVASAVIAEQGGTLTAEDALELLDALQAAQSGSLPRFKAADLGSR